MKNRQLFSAFRILDLELANRIVMAPMMRNKSPKHIPSKDVEEYYYRRALGDVGLIITEGVAINHKGSQGYENVPSMFGAEALSRWRSIVTRIHTTKTKIFAQLWHVGSIKQKTILSNSSDFNQKTCCDCNDPAIPGYGPSAIPHPSIKNAEIPEILTQKEIAHVIDAFAAAAQSAQNIGFDGIEIHGAHGYLIDQFFWHITNKRTDKYGGETLVARARFAVEVIKAIRKIVGKTYPISFRLSQWKLGALKWTPLAVPLLA